MAKADDHGSALFRVASSDLASIPQHGGGVL